MTIKLLSFIIPALFVIIAAFVAITSPLNAQFNTQLNTQTNIVNGDVIRATGSEDVYIVKIIGHKRFRRLILNPAVFDSYEFRWHKVKDVSHPVLNSYTNSNLTREVHANGTPVDNKIYALYSYGNTGVKRLVVGGSYDQDSVYNINSYEASDRFYRIGDPITLTATTSIPPQSGLFATPGTPANLRVLRTTPTTIDLHWQPVIGTSRYQVEWRVQGTDNEYWNFKTTQTLATIWGHIVPGNVYEIRVRTFEPTLGGYAHTTASSRYAVLNSAPTDTGFAQTRIAHTPQTSPYNKPVSDLSTLPANPRTISVSPTSGSSANAGSSATDSGLSGGSSSSASDSMMQESLTDAGLATNNQQPATNNQQPPAAPLVSEIKRDNGTLEYKYYYRSDRRTIERIDKYRENGKSLLYSSYYRPDQTLQYADFFRENGTLEIKRYYDENEKLVRTENYRANSTLEKVEFHQPDGRLKRLNQYYDNGALKQADIYRDIGTLQERLYYRSNGITLQQKDEHKQDGTVERSYYLVNGSLERKEKFKSGIKIEDVFYRSSGAVERSYHFRESGGSLRTKIYYYANEKIQRIEYYRTSGSLQQIVYYNSSGTKDRTLNYDANERLTKTVEH